MGSRHFKEAESPPRAGAYFNHRVAPGEPDNIADVVDDLVINIYLGLDELLHRNKEGLICHRLNEVGGVIPAPADASLQYEALFGLCGDISHAELYEESIHLGFREWIGALEFDGVLGRDDKKRER